MANSINNFGPIDDDFDPIDDDDFDPQDPFGSLDTDLSQAKMKKDTRQKFPCPSCAGTGVYRGARVHQEKSHCFSCRGKGFFLTDPRKLEERRKAQKEKKARDLSEGLVNFLHHQPEMFKELRDAHALRQGNDFILSLADQLFTKGSLTDNQIAAWHRGKEKLRRVQEETAKASSEVDLTPIRAMFETAVGNGYKRPSYRAEGLVISRAPDSGRNPGALYVKNENDVYGGKVMGTTFSPSQDGRRSDFVSGEGVSMTALEALVRISEDPLQAALRYGQRTGRCACCGRLLTNHTSIDLGIGPVCREKWGL